MRRLRGITLIELMTVMVVVGILAAIAVPSYRSYLLRSQRTEATTALLQLQTAQEKFFIQNNAYATDAQLDQAPPAGLGLPRETRSGFYVIALAADPSGYRATATPRAGGGQSDDDRCTAFSIDANGVKRATGSGANPTEDCWR